METTIKVGIRGIEKWIKASSEIQSKLDSFLYAQGVYFAGFVKEKQLTGQSLKVRTGRLRNSFGNPNSEHGIFKKQKGKIEIGTSVKYARIHEYGGKILPKGGKMLAIPLPSVLTPTGAPKFYWNRRGDIPKQFPDAFIIKSKKDGLPLLVRKTRKGLLPLFKLVPKVEIKKKWYLHKSANLYRPKFKSEFESFVKDIVE